MAKYEIWDKKIAIVTTVPDYRTGKTRYTAQEYIDEKAAWAGLPDAKVIISGGKVNGAVFEAFDERVAFYRSQGVEITDSMTDREVLDAMEAYDLNPPAPEPTEDELAERAAFEAVVALARDQVSSSSDDEIIKYGGLFPSWSPNVAYAAGGIVRHGDKLYKVAQPHTSQVDWTPDRAVSLFGQISDPADEWPEWIPYAGVSQYKVGNKVSHNGKHWECAQANAGEYNTFEPGVWGWKEVG